MNPSFLWVCVLSLLTSACAIPEVLDRTMPPGAMADVHLYTRDEDGSANLIDKALATCFEQTERSETRCVKEALSRSGISLRALMAMMPQCSIGAICHYDHTTRRRLGLFASYATLVVKDWRVSFDLRTMAPDVGLVPVQVTDRNIFIVPRSATPKVAVPGVAPDHI